MFGVSETICRGRGANCPTEAGATSAEVWNDMALEQWDDLSLGFARLLLWPDPAPLPAITISLSFEPAPQPIANAPPDIAAMPADIRHKGYSQKRSMLLVWENASPELPALIASGRAPQYPIDF